MGSVYKAVSRKNSRKAEMEDHDSEDMEMADLLAGADDTSDSESEEENEQASNKSQLSSGQLPKTRVLMLTSRGVTHRYVATERRKKRPKLTCPLCCIDTDISWPTSQHYYRTRTRKPSWTQKRNKRGTISFSTPLQISILAMSSSSSRHGSAVKISTSGYPDLPTAPRSDSVWPICIQWGKWGQGSLGTV